MISPVRNYTFFDPDPNARSQRFPLFRHDPELLGIEQILKGMNLVEFPQVQILLKRARTGLAPTRRNSKMRLLELIEAYKINDMRLQDPFYPPATRIQISNNLQGIHILDQATNEIPYFIDLNTPLRNILALGNPDGGKSSAVFNMLMMLRDIALLILDPKEIWKYRARELNAEVIEPPFSLDLTPPSNADWKSWMAAMMEGVAQISGLQFALIPLLDAAKTALVRKEEYTQRTGKPATLSLQDVHTAFCEQRLQRNKADNYLISAITGVRLILGENDLFSTRKGIPLSEILSGRYILPCSHLGVTQSRFLAFLLLTYMMFATRGMLERTTLDAVVVFDDASSFINCPSNAFGTGPRTSFWGAILSKLRKTGRGLVFVDQLVTPIHEDVKQLCGSWLVIGGLQDMQNFREIASAMNLDEEQAQHIGKLKQRECVFYCPSHYPRAVHGMIPLVSTINEEDFSGDGSYPKADFEMIAWQPLIDVGKVTVTSEKPGDKAKTMDEGEMPVKTNETDMLSLVAKRLMGDCVCNLFDQSRQRIKRLDVSVRVYQAAKHELIEKGRVKESGVGKAKYIIPMPMAFKQLGLPCPYSNVTFVEHSYYALMFSHYLKQQQDIQEVHIEYKVGRSGHTADIATISRDGELRAFEITRSAANVLQNCQKYEGTAFCQITFLCQSLDLTKAVESMIRGKLSVELQDKIRCIPFSRFIKEMKASNNKGS